MSPVTFDTRRSPLLERAVTQSRERLRDFSQQLADGSASVPQWHAAMATELKQLHIMAALAGSGSDTLDNAQRAAVSQRLGGQLDYLRQFARDVESGQQALDGQFLARAGMYAGAAWGTYGEAQREQARGDGAQWERRVIHSGESCPSCVEYAAMGWQPVGTLPAPGEASECLTNCLCSLEYSDAADQPDDDEEGDTPEEEQPTEEDVQTQEEDVTPDEEPSPEPVALEPIAPVPTPSSPLPPGEEDTVARIVTKALDYLERGPLQHPAYPVSDDAARRRHIVGITHRIGEISEEAALEVARQLHLPGEPRTKAAVKAALAEWLGAAQFYSPDQPRDERGRFGEATGAMKAAHPFPKGPTPERPAGSSRPDLVAKEPKLAAAVQAAHEHGDAYQRAHIADLVHGLLTSPAETVPLPPSHFTPGQRVARAKRALEDVASKSADVTTLSDAFKSHQDKVTASHPAGGAALAAARAEAARRYEQAVAVARQHVEQLPPGQREKGERALKRVLGEAGFAFCPTGEGGGVDPSCSSKGGGGALTISPIHPGDKVRFGPDFNAIEGEVAGLPITTTERQVIQKLSKKTKATLETTMADPEVQHALKVGGIQVVRVEPTKGVGKPQSGWTAAHADNALLIHPKTGEAIEQSKVPERRDHGLKRIVHHEVGHAVWEKAQKQDQAAFADNLNKHPDVISDVSRIVSVAAMPNAFHNTGSRVVTESFAELSAMRKYDPTKYAQLPQVIREPLERMHAHAEKLASDRRAAAFAFCPTGPDATPDDPSAREN